MGVPIKPGVEVGVGVGVGVGAGRIFGFLDFGIWQQISISPWHFEVVGSNIGNALLMSKSPAPSVTTLPFSHR